MVLKERIISSTSFLFNVMRSNKYTIIASFILSWIKTMFVLSYSYRAFRNSRRLLVCPLIIRAFRSQHGNKNYRKGSSKVVWWCFIAAFYIHIFAIFRYLTLYFITFFIYFYYIKIDINFLIAFLKYCKIFKTNY